jgi:hypothetical protein
MDYRRWAAILEGAFAALVVGLHVVAVALAPRLAQDGHGGLMLDVLPVCQLGLIVAWVLLGPAFCWLRVWLTPMLLGIGAACWTWMWQGRGTGINGAGIPLLISTAVITGCLLAAVRFAGLAIRQHPSHSDTAAQFSIRSLLVLTTMVAVAIACLERLRPHLAWSPASFSRLDILWEPIRDLTSQVGAAHAPRLAVLSSVAAGVIVAAIWAVMRPGSPWLRTLATGISAAATGAYLVHLVDGWPNWELPIGLVLLAAFVGTSVLPLRLMGFRLERAASCTSNASAAGGDPSLDGGLGGFQHEDTKATKRLTVA